MAGLEEWSWLLQNQYVLALFVVLASMIVAKIFQGIFVHYMKKLTEKTKTDIDDIIIKISSRPLFYLILVAGSYVALRTLDTIESHVVWINRVFFAVSMVIVAWLSAKIFSLLITRWFKSHRGLQGTPKIIKLIVSIIVYVIALIIILSYFDIEISPLVATLGIGGLAVGLALQDTLSNVFAGIHIVSDQPIRVKDFVEIPSDNVSGTVEDIGWRSTRIRTFANNIVIVPNSTVAGSILTNYAMPEQEVKTVVMCGVDYTSDLEYVEQVTLDVATKAQKTVDGAVKDFEPIFRFYNFGDNNIDFKIILSALTRGDKFKLEHDFIKMLHKRFARDGIEISWPIRKQYPMPAVIPKKVKKKPVKVIKKKMRSRQEDDI